MSTAVAFLVITAVTVAGAGPAQDPPQAAQARPEEGGPCFAPPYPFTSVCEYDPATDRFVGVVRHEGHSLVAWVEAGAREPTVHGELPPLGGLVRTEAAIDPSSRRLFFFGHSADGYSLVAIDLESGAARTCVTLPQHIRALAHDQERDRLVGFWPRDDATWFVSLDPASGNVEETQVEVDGSVRCGSALVGPDRLLFLAGDTKATRLYAIDLGHRSVDELPSWEVGVDDFHAWSADEDGAPAAVFTRGVHACTGIAAWDAQNRVGLVLHVSYQNRSVEELIADAAARLHELGCSLDSMEVTVIGGVRDPAQSARTLRRALRALTTIHAVQCQRIRRLNTGVSRNLAVVNGSILVF